MDLCTPESHSNVRCSKCTVLSEQQNTNFHVWPDWMNTPVWLSKLQQPHRPQQSCGFLRHCPVKNIIPPFLGKRVRHHDFQLVFSSPHQPAHIKPVRRTDAHAGIFPVYPYLRRFIYTSQVQIISVPGLFCRKSCLHIPEAVPVPQDYRAMSQEEVPLRLYGYPTGISYIPP